MSHDAARSTQIQYISLYGRGEGRNRQLRDQHLLAWVWSGSPRRGSPLRPRGRGRGPTADWIPPAHTRVRAQIFKAVSLLFISQYALCRLYVERALRLCLWRQASGLSEVRGVF